MAHNRDKRVAASKLVAAGNNADPKGKIGRPSIKTPELLKAICDGISTGKSARAMCIEVGINRSTLLDWLAADNAFSTRYARARELCADVLVEQLLEIADEKASVTIEDGKAVTDPQFAQTQRLRFDARKWIASKLLPRVYGDKLALDVAQDNPIATMTAVQVREALETLRLYREERREKLIMLSEPPTFDAIGPPKPLDGSA